MQYHTARKVTPDFHCSNTRHDFLGISTNEDTFSSSRFVCFTAQPSLILCSEINWTTERLGPDQVGCVIVWVRNYNSFESAKGVYLLGLSFLQKVLEGEETSKYYHVYCFLIQVRYQIPKNIAVFGLQQDSPLSNPKLCYI